MNNVEIERKFLIDPEKIPFKLEDYEYEDMIQGYISGYNNFTYRLRKSKQGGKTEYFQTIKGKGYKLRSEFEINLSEKDFDKMWILCKDITISKHRYHVPYGGKILYLDEYKGPVKGLYTLEIEFDNEDDCDDYKPSYWFGPEVTYDSRFTNSQLAKNGLPKNYKMYGV